MNRGFIKDDPKIFLVPHTHYDAIWVFNKEDYYYINIDLILKQSLDLIKKSGYKFLIEQTFLLEHVEANYPQLFTEVIKYAKEKKIEVAGGQYLLSDVMLPNGEVLIKEILDGKRYVKQKLDQDVIVAWGADEFGFNAQWPQILKGCGYKYFAFRRGVDRPKPSEFLWSGLDGSSILCHWMPLGYRAGLDLTKLGESYHKLKEFAATDLILMPSGSGVTLPQPETAIAVEEWNKEHANDNTKMIIATASQFFDSLAGRAIEQKHNFEVRTGEMYSGRLSEVFPDCTSSRMWIKQGTKEFENYLLALERWNAISRLENCSDSSELLKNYWKKILFIAMHDALPGTGIDEVYDEIKEIFGSMQQGVRKSLIGSLGELSKRIEIKKGNNDTPGRFIVVFNSLPWDVKDWTEANLEFDEGAIRGIASLRIIGNDNNEGHKSGGSDKSYDDNAYDVNSSNNKNKKSSSGGSNSKSIDLEIIDSTFFPDNSIKQIKIGFIAEVSAFGFQSFEIIPEDGKPIQSTSSSPETHFKNSEFEVQVNPENATITVTKNGKPFVRNGNELLLEEELGDLYYHRENLGLLKSESGAGVKYGSFKPENFIVKKGKLRSHIVLDSKYYALRWPYRLTSKLKPQLYRHNFLDIQKEIIIYNDLARIDFVTHIHDRHPHSRIRVKFDISSSISNQIYWSGTQFGAIERKVNQFYYKEDFADNSAKSSNIKSVWSEKPNGIFPSLEWIDYSDKDQKGGVSVLHKGIPSHEIRDNSIFLTLLRSVVVLSSDGIMGPCIPTPDAAETRPYTFRYSLLPHDGGWKEAATYRHGMEVNLPLIAIQVKNSQNGTSSYDASQLKGERRYENNPQRYLPSSYSFLKIDPRNVVLSTLKISEDGEAIIIRFYETEGKKTTARLTFARQTKSVWITDLLENNIEQIIDEDGNKNNQKKKDNNNNIKNSNPLEIEVDPFKIVTLKIKF
ncbi:MAG TPA: glycosyl hydrolase-related protein [Nitrososphaeraceae archaeon]|nr:glycosyl hydrolase-related protein [Nitrososphaeraceae archaeon]